MKPACFGTKYSKIPCNVCKVLTECLESKGVIIMDRESMPGDKKKILHMLTKVDDVFSLTIYKKAYNISDKQFIDYKNRMRFEKSQGIERNANGEFVK